MVGYFAEYISVGWNLLSGCFENVFPTLVAFGIFIEKSGVSPIGLSLHITYTPKKQKWD